MVSLHELGQPLGISDIKSLAAAAHGDAGVRQELMALTVKSDDREATNAAWALLHLPAKDSVYLEAYRDRFVEKAMGTENGSLRRLILALLERVRWEESDVRADFLDFCLGGMMSGDEAVGVRSLCAKIAYMMCRHNTYLLAELRSSLMIIEDDTISQGMKCVKHKLLSKI